MTQDNQPALVGTGLSDQLDGTGQNDVMAGLAGDDSMNGHAGNDLVYGDYAQENLFDGTANASSFSDYQATGAWQVNDLQNGHQEMLQTISTEIGGVYSLDLSLAANFAGGQASAAVEILVDGVVIATFETQSGAFGDHNVQFTATDTQSAVTIRSVSAGTDGPEIDTSGPAFHYDREMEIGGQNVTVAAFADGQSNLYQVLNGTLHVFDVESQTYELAGVAGTVNVNSMGYNVEDDLLYAIAVSDGVDSLGQTVSRSDLVMLDAEGKSYRIGDTPYRAWTGDFDDQGNLWSFQSSMNHIAVIDVDQLDADGNPAVEVHKLPKELIGFNVYDVAFDASTQSFYGVARPASEGADTVMLVIDISGSEPEFRTVAVTSTLIDGQVRDGVPAMTFGAAIIDADGNLFVGGNSGDHDMDNSTGNSGGIFEVVVDETTGEASLHLIEAAPSSYSNDGAADPTAENPFVEVDLNSSVLVRDISLVATTEGELSYDDYLSGADGQDTMLGGIGVDTLVGGSRGDSLQGNDGSDMIHGGAGFDSISTSVSVYDNDGLRYDAFGNLLPEDDDYLSGGAGADTLSGSAGHDTLDGGAGNDALTGGTGWDELHGGTGDDYLSGGSQVDLLFGGEGRDTLEGGTADDEMFGGSGDDEIAGGSGNDVADGGDGEDSLNGGSGDDQLSGGAGSDTMIGGSGDDNLNGDAGDDVINAGSGNDTVEGGDGDDNLKGSSGDDEVYGGNGRDKLNGGSGADIMFGGEGNDYLHGYTGDDTIDGGAGNDKIHLGAGADVASGGQGADCFVFRFEDIDGSTDRIEDFSLLENDRLDLRGLNLDESFDDLGTWFETQITQVGSDIHIDFADVTTLIITGLGGQQDGLLDCILF